MTMPTMHRLDTRRSARSHSRPVGSGGPHPYPYHRGDVSAGREEGQGARSSSIHRPQRLGIVRSTPWVGPLRRRPAPGAVGAICTHSAAQITLRVIVAGKGLTPSPPRRLQPWRRGPVRAARPMASSATHRTAYRGRS